MPHSVPRRAPVAVLTLMASAFPAFAQGAQRQSPIELDVPMRPTPVVAEGKRVLAYELHITNFGQRPLSLQAVDVFSALASRQPLATISGGALASSFQIGGVMRMAGMDSTKSNVDATRIEPGQRVVVFVWIARPLGDPVPQTLRQRLQFTVSDSGTPSSIDSLVIPVARAAGPPLSAPLLGGDWLAGDGPSNTSAHRRAIVPVNGHAWIAQRFATDWVRVGPNGNTWHDDRSRNENFWSFGEPVLAVGDAEVASAVDSMTDNVPGHMPEATLSNLAGNHIILKLADGRYALYAHLRHGSLTVRQGQRVSAGQTLAHVGNSGQATAPHLHFQLMDGPSELAAEGIPFVFDQFTFIDYGRDYEPGKPHQSVIKRNEMPVEDAVVRFRDQRAR
jgi:murein DD-endopeptidase